MLFALQLFVFGLATWVGLYLVANDVGRGRQWLAACAVLDLATAVVVTVLRPDAVGLRWATALVVASATLWVGVVVGLMPAEPGARRWQNAWRFGLLPLTCVLLGVMLFGASSGAVWGLLTLAVVIVPLLLAYVAAVRAPDAPLAREVRWLLALATTFYVLSVSALVLVS